MEMQFLDDGKYSIQVKKWAGLGNNRPILECPFNCKRLLNGHIKMELMSVPHPTHFSLIHFRPTNKVQLIINIQLYTHFACLNGCYMDPSAHAICLVNQILFIMKKIGLTPTKKWLRPGLTCFGYCPVGPMVSVVF